PASKRSLRPSRVAPLPSRRGESEGKSSGPRCVRRAPIREADRAPRSTRGTAPRPRGLASLRKSPSTARGRAPRRGRKRARRPERGALARAKKGEKQDDADRQRRERGQGAPRTRDARHLQQVARQVNRERGAAPPPRRAG